MRNKSMGAKALNSESVVMYQLPNDDEDFPETEACLTVLCAQGEGMAAQSVFIWGTTAVRNLKDACVEVLNAHHRQEQLARRSKEDEKG